MRLINKDVLMSDMGSARGCWVSCADCGKINCLVGEIIDRQPTVDAEPVRHGEWIEKRSGTGVFDYYFVCSECHKNTTGFLISPDYCPHCGAKMDGD